MFLRPSHSLSRSVVLLLSAFILLGAHGQLLPQQGPHTCGFDHIHEEMLMDALYETRTEDFNMMATGTAGISMMSLTTYKIPVVVHVMETGNSLTAISDDQIRGAIRAMNQRFRKVPGSPGAGNGVDVDIEFVLAVRDPQGNCTNGITRVDMTGNSGYMANGVFRQSAGIADATLKALAAWDPSRYYNIYAVSEIDNNNGGSGIQGYALFASSHGTPADGTVVLAGRLRDPENTTLAHELGHALNLYHTFEGDNDGASCPPNSSCTTQGDLVCDTPPHIRSASNCNTGGTNTCDGGSSNLLFVRNYMDYSSSACMNMFTAGQASRMTLAISGVRASFLAANGNLSLVPPSTPVVDFYASASVLCATGQSVTLFDASTCIPKTYLGDSEFPGITYSWTLTNGVNTHTSTVQNPTFTLNNAGTYTATLSVTTSFGTQTRTEAGIVVVNTSAMPAVCTPASFNPQGNYGLTVSQVRFNTLENNTSASVNGVYQNFACTHNTVVARNASYPLTITFNGTSANAQTYSAFIDYNNNGVFDAGELVASGSTNAAGTTVTTNITIPNTAVLNTMLRLRVYGEVGTLTANKRNCLDQLLLADVEDYGVYVVTTLASVSINASPGTTVSHGTNVTFTPTPVNGGASPTYIWYRNGSPVATTTTYASNSLLPGDQIRCEMFSSLAGVIGSPAQSNVLTMNVTGPPLSDFTVNSTTTCTGTNITFTDASLLSPTSWSWSFPGGTPASSTAQNPVVSYATSGTKTVTLVASNALGTGTTMTKTAYITVYAAAPTACAVTRSLDNTGTNIGILNVKLHTIDHTTPFNDPVMNNFSCSQMATLQPGTQYPISVTLGNNNSQWVRVYIDYNRNGVFTDAGELVFSPANGTGVRSGTFTTPASPSQTGNLLRMRVITDFINTTPGPCTNPVHYGQVEEYGIIMAAPLQTITTGTIAGVPFCAGAAVSVPYTVSSAFNAGNTFTAQLSGPTGSFASPVAIGTLAGTGSGTISATIPIGTATGTGYRIRVVGSAPAVTGSDNGTNLTINAPPSATLSYAGSPYCSNSGTATVTRTGTTGGTYSASPAGLSINSSTGAVTLGSSTPGSYTVTYTIAASGGCAAFSTTAGITVTAAPSAAISYTGSPYCSNSGTATVTRTGTTGGTYSASPAGLSINSTTGAVTLGSSTAGSYTVTYTIAASGGCAQFSTTAGINITAAPSATISYPGTPYCINSGTATITRTGTTGGTYTATPAGVVINSSTGAVTLGTSTPGTYTVTYTIAASGGCAQFQTTTGITIQPDTDGDGICDPNDNCPYVPGQIGSPCDDGNPNTVNDVLNASCVCQGTLMLLGDMVCSAVPLQYGVNGLFSNVGATVQPGEPSPPLGSCTSQFSWCSGGGPASNTVWFTFTAPSTGRISLNFGSTANWDSRLAVWSAASCNALLTGGAVLLAANDDITGAPPYHAAILPLCVNPGQTYYVQVDGYGTSTSSAFELVLVEEAPFATASITADISVLCYDESTPIFINGTAGAIVAYSINGGPAQSDTLIGGTFVMDTGPLASSVSYTLISVSANGCTSLIGSTVNIDVKPLLQIMSLTASPQVVCAGGTTELSATSTQPPLKVIISGPGHHQDELVWTIHNSAGQLVDQGGPYTFGTYIEHVIPWATLPPYTFNIQTLGTYNDNQASYSVECEGSTILDGYITGGTTFSQDALDCSYDVFFEWTPFELFATNLSGTVTSQPLETDAHLTVTAYMVLPGRPFIFPPPQGCIASASVFVDVIPAPVIATILAEPLVPCPGEDVQLSVSLADDPVYCTTGLYGASGCTEGDDITNVQFAGISRSSQCDGGSAGYSLHTAPQATVVAGQSYSFSMSTSTQYPQGGAAWVDWNQNGIFEAGEQIVSGYTGSTGAVYAVASYTVPLTARNGITRLRVRCTYIFNPDNNPCGARNYGEVEEYYVNVTGGQPGMSYSWSPAAGLHDPSSPLPIAQNVNTDRQYTLTVTAPNGCTAEQTIDLQPDQTDTDGDGIPDCLDDCPLLPGMQGDPCDPGPGYINGIIDNECLCVGTPIADHVDVSAAAVLDGAYDPADGRMRDDLRALGLIPALQPYSMPPFNYYGTETVYTAVLMDPHPYNAIVDWVLLELRDATTSNTVIATRAALLRRDGAIVDTDGTSAVRFNNVSAGNYRLAIRHRNHIGVITANSYALGAIPTEIDLTSGTHPVTSGLINPDGASTTLQGRKSIAGLDPILGMWGGNARNVDHVLAYFGAGSDRQEILDGVGSTTPFNTILNVYSAADVNMDGKVEYFGTASDRQFVLDNVGSAAPFNILSLPVE